MELFLHSNMFGILDHYQHTHRLGQRFKQVCRAQLIPLYVWYDIEFLRTKSHSRIVSPAVSRTFSNEPFFNVHVPLHSLWGCGVDSLFLEQGPSFQLGTVRFACGSPACRNSGHCVLFDRPSEISLPAAHGYARYNGVPFSIFKKGQKPGLISKRHTDQLPVVLFYISLVKQNAVCFSFIIESRKHTAFFVKSEMNSKVKKLQLQKPELFGGDTRI